MAYGEPDDGVGVVEVVSQSGPWVDPAPLFDQVTGLPPDDAVDVTVPLPLSLAVHMTVLESTGRAAELAVLQKLHIELAREAVRTIQARVGAITRPAAAPSARLRITHIVEQRVPGVNGLRPHLHAYVGVTVRSPADDGEPLVDVEALEALVDAEVVPAHRARLVAATGERAGLVWGETSWSPCEVLGSRWLAERTAQRRHEDLSCRGPWPRRQIVASTAAARGRDALRSWE